VDVAPAAASIAFAIHTGHIRFIRGYFGQLSGSPHKYDERIAAFGHRNRIFIVLHKIISMSLHSNFFQLVTSRLPINISFAFLFRLHDGFRSTLEITSARRISSGNLRNRGESNRAFASV
jgi:hypothetical protein